MRTIKFRAWDKKHTHWTILDLTECDAITLIKNVEYQQYTGLKDSNGKEIYEGDIVIRSWGKNEKIEEVKDIGFDLKLSELESGGITEVIGNIYQNPELLK